MSEVPPPTKTPEDRWDEALDLVKDPNIQPDRTSAMKLRNLLLTWLSASNSDRLGEIVHLTLDDFDYRVPVITDEGVPGFVVKVYFHFFCLTLNC